MFFDKNSTTLGCTRTHVKEGMENLLSGVDEFLDQVPVNVSDFHNCVRVTKNLNCLENYL